MQANAVGDPEKMFVDTCMRDFEGLPVTSERYLAAQQNCIQELLRADRFQWLPRIRLPVDEQVCEPTSLCKSGDPGQCDDTGAPSDSDYGPGTVTQCYRLIDQAKAEWKHTQKALLMASVEDRCTGSNVWNSYGRSVLLKYCMWKHLTVGVCMNSMVTNCPEDTSCCPVAQNYAGAGSMLRPNRYLCQKSPTVGLFCQDVDDRMGAGTGSNKTGSFCTAATCPSFAWCQDLADVPGLCLGEACIAYQRALVLAVLSAICISLAVIFDIFEFLVLVRWRVPPKVKVGANVTGACLKMMAYLFCIVGDIEDLLREALRNSCFNADGAERVRQGQVSLAAARGLALAAMSASICLCMLTARWGNHLIGLPHVKSSYQSP